MSGRLLHFLLVEDDRDHAELVLRTIERDGTCSSVDHVLDGGAALAYLRNEGPYADRPRPDVVLLDLKLPRIDGHEVLARIKQDPALASIPVVVLTTSAAEKDRIRAYENRVNSYLVKPVDFSRFKKMVTDLSRYWGVWNETAPH